MIEMEVKRHELVNPNMASMMREEFHSRINRRGLPVLERDSWELGSFLGTYLQNAAIGIATGAPTLEVHEELCNAARIGQLHFKLASRRSIGEAFTIAGKTHQLPANNATSFTALSYWIISVRVSMITRDEKGLQDLLLSAIALYGDGFSKLEKNDRLEGLLYMSIARGDKEQAAMSINELLQSPSSSEYFKLLKGPELALWLSLLTNKFTSDQLADALSNHQIFWGTQENRSNANGWISLPLLHACAYAHDHGMEIEVESDYIPRWLVTGDFD